MVSKSDFLKPNVQKIAITSIYKLVATIYALIINNQIDDYSVTTES